MFTNIFNLYICGVINPAFSYHEPSTIHTSLVNKMRTFTISIIDKIIDIDRKTSPFFKRGSMQRKLFGDR